MNGNRDNEIVNNNNNVQIIRGNSIVSSIDYNFSRSENDLITELNNIGNLDNLKVILRRVIEELRREGYNPRIMEDKNDGNGEKPVEIEEIENVNVIKMVIPVNWN